MSDYNGGLPTKRKALTIKLRESFSQIPLLGWLLGALIAVVLEHFCGDLLVDLVGLPKVPVLFGCLIVLKKPLLIPSACFFVLLIYLSKRLA